MVGVFKHGIAYIHSVLFRFRNEVFEVILQIFIVVIRRDYFDIHILKSGYIRRFLYSERKNGSCITLRLDGQSANSANCAYSRAHDIYLILVSSEFCYGVIERFVQKFRHCVGFYPIIGTRSKRYERVRHDGNMLPFALFYSVEHISRFRHLSYVVHSESLLVVQVYYYRQS